MMIPRNAAESSRCIGLGQCTTMSNDVCSCWRRTLHRMSHLPSYTPTTRLLPWWKQMLAQPWASRHGPMILSHNYDESCVCCDANTWYIVIWIGRISSSTKRPAESILLILEMPLFGKVNQVIQKKKVELGGIGKTISDEIWSTYSTFGGNNMMNSNSWKIWSPRLNFSEREIRPGYGKPPLALCEQRANSYLSLLQEDTM